VFESLANYMHWWMLPLLFVFLLGWLLGCGQLLRFSLQRRLEERHPRSLAVCVFHVLLAGGFAAVSGLVVTYLVYQLGARADAKLVLPAATAGFVVMPIVAYLILLAMLNLSARQTLAAAVPPLGGLVALTVVLGLGAGIPARILRTREVRQQRSVGQLLRIYGAITGQFETSFGRAPEDLRELVEKNILDAKHLQSPGLPDAEIGFFYLSTPTVRDEDAQSKRLFACERRGSHDGRGRAVVYTDGDAEWVTEGRFQQLLKRPENKEFAEALRALENR